ncbi:hypothetical protein Droror1_Dr00001466 [Drosera rotundifolia]
MTQNLNPDSTTTTSKTDHHPFQFNIGSLPKGTTSSSLSYQVRSCSKHRTLQVYESAALPITGSTLSTRPRKQHRPQSNPANNKSRAAILQSKLLCPQTSIKKPHRINSPTTTSNQRTQSSSPPCPQSICSQTPPSRDDINTTVLLAAHPRSRSEQHHQDHCRTTHTFNTTDVPIQQRPSRGPSTTSQTRLYEPSTTTPCHKPHHTKTTERDEERL